MTNILLLTTSWALLALIWVVQLVHYPSFEYIDNTKFRAFHQHHTTSITWIVLPLMLCELVNVLWMSYQSDFAPMPLLFLGIVLCIWASTFFISIPLHTKLTQGKKTKYIEQLIATNWIRTILWTIKAVLVVWYFWGMEQ